MDWIAAAWMDGWTRTVLCTGITMMGGMPIHTECDAATEQRHWQIQARHDRTTVAAASETVVAHHEGRPRSSSGRLT